MRKLFGALVMLSGVPGAALAVDGVVEINQERALAGGVTATDTPGFPVILSEPGSYRLTGNLDVVNPDPSLPHGILINTPGVTLDLNGFGLQGPVSCTGIGAAVVCSTGSGGAEGNTPPHAIISFADGTAVFNGWVRGFDEGVELRNRSRAERLIVSEIDGTAIDVDEGSLVLASTAGVSVTGFRAQEGSVIVDSTAHDNRDAGFSVDRVTLRGCGAQGNGEDGILASGMSTLVGNVTINNGDDGIDASGGGVVEGNVSRGNGSDQIAATAEPSMVRSNVVHTPNDAGYGLRLGPGTSYKDNSIMADGTALGTVTSGIDLGGNRCNRLACP